MNKVVDDFKDRNGKWVKSFRMYGEHVFTSAGKLHNNMMSRCGTKSFKSVHKSYENVAASENFKDFQFFAEWCNSQIGYNVAGYQLEKDLLGSRQYHEDTCVFLPKEINSALISGGNVREILPSVHHNCSRFFASFRVNNTKVNLPIRATYEEAFEDYKEFKELYLRELAEKYKGSISQKAYNGLVNYQIINRQERLPYGNIITHVQEVPISSFGPKNKIYNPDYIANSM